MDHPDFIPCALFFVIAIVIWRLLCYINTVFPSGVPVAGDNEVNDTSQTKLPEKGKNPGCIWSIVSTILLIIALAVPFFMTFLIFANITR